MSTGAYVRGQLLNAFPPGAQSAPGRFAGKRASGDSSSPRAELGAYLDALRGRALVRADLSTSDL